MLPYTIEADANGGFRLPIATHLWGPIMWDAMHFISLGYPEDNPTPGVRLAAFEFLTSLPYLLPCSLCRVHLADAFRGEMPLTTEVFGSKQALGSYIVALRDLVKRKHACPSCDTRPHTFAIDVEERLLGTKNFWWLLLIPAFTIPFLYITRTYRKYGDRS
jgi:hypothetical protein